ncbi:MAG: transposase [Deltaproteobacteria bacterium]|nr:transposase [Deltaproteobacteria bacterium]MBI3293515.1 transposase [Deltaproteobacteria bacterium]
MGRWSIITVRTWLRDYLPKLAKRLGITLYHFSNNGSHIHVVLNAPSRAAQASFLRALAGMIARRVLKAEKGNGSGVNFWTERPYSRLVTWGREFSNVMLYVHRNLMEAAGLIPYFERDGELPEFWRRRITISLSRMGPRIHGWATGQGQLF